MSVLDNAITKPPRKLPIFMLHGTTGIGKSTFGTNPKYKPWYIDIEGSLGEINVPRLPRVKTTAQVYKQISDLRNNKHDYKLCGIDTLDAFQRLQIAEICKNAGAEGLNSSPLDYGKGKKILFAETQRFIEKLTDLNENREMMICIIAHTKPHSRDEPDAPKYDKYGLALTEDTEELYRQWCDVLGFVRYLKSVDVNKSFTEKNKAVGQMSQRFLYLEEDAAFYAKNRYLLPKKMNFDLDEVVTAIYDEDRIAAAKKAKGLPEWMI